MRKTVLLVDVQVTEVQAFSLSQYEYYSHEAAHLIDPVEGPMVCPEVKVNKHLVPITRFCHTGKPDLYVAYTEYLEEVLGIPIRTIIKEKDEWLGACQSARKEAERWKARYSAINCMTLWQRLKFLIKPVKTLEALP